MSAIGFVMRKTRNCLVHSTRLLAQAGYKSPFDFQSKGLRPFPPLRDGNCFVKVREIRRLTDPEQRRSCTRGGDQSEEQGAELMHSLQDPAGADVSALYPPRPAPLYTPSFRAAHSVQPWLYHSFRSSSSTRKIFLLSILYAKNFFGEDSRTRAGKPCESGKARSACLLNLPWLAS